MLRFLARLLGIGENPAERVHPGADSRERPGRRSSPGTNRYFVLLGDLKEAKRKRDWSTGANVAHELIAVIPEFVREWRREAGDLPPSLPLFTDGARCLAMVGDDSGLERLLALTQDITELREWETAAVEAVQDREYLQRVRDLLANEPGILQQDVAEAIGAEDGRRISVLLRQLEEGGEIKRLRYKKTYVLGLANETLSLPEDHPAHPSRSPGRPSDAVTIAVTFDARHERRGSLKTVEIDLRRLEYIPLPRSPLRWEERQKKSGEPSQAENPFELGQGTPWQIDRVEKLPMEQRPDPAYRKLAPHAAGTFMIDDLGKTERFPGAPAALLAVERSGVIRSEAPLRWGLYRWEVNPMGAGFIAMDDEGIVHAYDEALRPIFATPLKNAPEMSELMTRLDFDATNLKNHTRTVSLSPSNAAYLFTVVDRAFVIGSDGSARWSVQFPKQEGWTRLAEVSHHAGTSAEISEALEVLELRMPVTVEEVRTSYRRLAKAWHPDVNRSSSAEERFKRISRASEILSGLDLRSLAPEVVRPTYEKIAGEGEWEIEGMRITVQFGMVAGEKQASDWIYASSFATDGGVYLGGYSGRVVLIDQSGRPVRAYDIGAVPRRIADTGDYLYFLTDTRLYILKDQYLVRLLDVFEEGELVIGQTGFGLLEKKRFRWFTEDGQLVGSVLTQNPIRRIHSTPTGLTIETRQKRAEITGAPGWWGESKIGERL